MTSKTILSLVAICALFFFSVPADAQILQETQPPVPLGGNDIRGLPDRKQLPPMFGANLFAGPSVSLDGGIAATQRAATTPNAQGAPAAAAGGIAAAGTASAMAGMVGAAGAAVSLQPAIPATSVQPPPNVAPFDPNHVMAPGDIVQVHIYGATTLDQQVTVDANNDIFLPSIGPVSVADTLAGNLPQVVAAAVGSIYHTNAQIYVTLATAAPIHVFVTGAVVAPGQYSQPSTASVITLLQAAGGIDANRGSYRDIAIIRDGAKIAAMDLYDFLLNGSSPPVHLRDNDTILVGPQRAVVAAEGDVSGVFRYELPIPMNGSQLIALARPYADATRVSVVGIRDGRPTTMNYSLTQFGAITVENGDVVSFSPDAPSDTITIKIEGRIAGPTTMTVARQATLFDVLPYIAIDKYFSDPSSIYIRRVSVAQAQTTAIHDAMQRLQATVITSPVITAQQAQMRQSEAQIVTQFAQLLTDVKPEGRVVLAHNGQLENIRLEDGDVIVAPSRTDLVLVSGEVRLPQAVVWSRDTDYRHYVDTAGGFTDRADKGNILVVRPSGETIVAKNPAVYAGDRVVVLPASDDWTLPFVSDLTQVIYQVAVTAGIAWTLK